MEDNDSHWWVRVKYEQYIHRESLNPLPPVTITISHKPMRIYMGSLILGVNTLYMVFCF